MATAQRINRLLLLSFAAAMAAAQQSGSASPTVTSPAASSVTGAADGATDVALSLWSVANSLLTSYYPSTTLDGVASLSWPSTVVIDGTPYNAAEATPTSLSTSLSTHQAVVSISPTSTGTAGADHAHHTETLSDKKLGIIIGVVVGLVVLVLLGVIFWCLRRRRDDTGSFFMRRRTPSIASCDSGVRSWLPGSRPDTYGTTTYVSAGESNPDGWEKQMASRPQMGEPRMSQHPAFASAHLNGSSSRSTSDENPFYTPAERMDRQLGQDVDLERGPYDPHPVELDDNGRSRPRSSSSLELSGDRPATPFAPMEMMGFGASRAAPSAQVDRRDFGENPVQHQSQLANPFSSPEDEEENDIVSPILPSRSPDRQHSPMVHYPSWSEVSEFDFSSDGRRSVGTQRLRNMSSNETDGEDGWHPVREQTSGRYELA